MFINLGSVNWNKPSQAMSINVSLAFGLNAMVAASWALEEQETSFGERQERAASCLARKPQYIPKSFAGEQKRSHDNHTNNIKKVEVI